MPPMLTARRDGGAGARPTGSPSPGHGRPRGGTTESAGDGLAGATDPGHGDTTGPCGEPAAPDDERRRAGLPGPVSADPGRPLEARAGGGEGGGIDGGDGLTPGGIGRGIATDEHAKRSRSMRITPPSTGSRGFTGALRQAGPRQGARPEAGRAADWSARLPGPPAMAGAADPCRAEPDTAPPRIDWPCASCPSSQSPQLAAASRPLPSDTATAPRAARSSPRNMVAVRRADNMTGPTVG